MLVSGRVILQNVPSLIHFSYPHWLTNSPGSSKVGKWFLTPQVGYVSSREGVMKGTVQVIKNARITSAVDSLLEFLLRMNYTQLSKWYEEP